MKDQTEPGKYPLRPIGIGTILLIVGLGLIVADLIEYFHRHPQLPAIPVFYISHWAGEFVVLGLVFTILYYPLKSRRIQRQELLRALKLSESQYRTLVEGLDAGVALIDNQNHLIKCNKAMESYMGDPQCLVSSRRCYELLAYAGETVCASCPGRTTLATGEPATTEMTLPETAARALQVVKVSTFPVADAEGEINQFIEVVEDITEEKIARAEIQRLNREIISAAETERKRLARDLHDQCGQVLAGVQYSLEALRTEIVMDLPEVSGHFDSISNLVEQIGDNIRQVSTQLHPSVLDDLGLIPTLQWLVDQSRTQRPDIVFTFAADPVPDGLAPDFYTTIYRVCQESLNNVSKHSNATGVEITLRCTSDAVLLEILDNGRGFSAVDVLSNATLSGHVGLHGMRERVQSMDGTLIVNSVPGGGAQIKASIPWSLEG